MSQKPLPLISIVVITYNSAEYLIETLESAKAQTYPNIELIITDDCSSDKTIDICTEWIHKNGSRFKQAKIVQTEYNQGITANCNRGLSNASGDWIKFIAGDDILKESCLQDNFDFINSNSTINVVISQYQVFNVEFKTSNYLAVRPPENLNLFFDMSAEKQYEYMIANCPALILGLFMRRNTLTEVGGFDQRFKNIEDIPLLINLLKSKFKLNYLPVITAFYRVNLTSMSNQKSLFYKKVIKDALRIYIVLRRPFLSINYKIHNDLYFLGEYLTTYIFRYINFDWGKKVSRILLLLSPVQFKLRKETKKRKP